MTVAYVMIACATAALLAVTGYIAWKMRSMPVERTAANCLYPFSQALLLGFSIWYGCANAQTLTVMLLSGFALVCAGADVLLFRRLWVGEHAALFAEKADMLAKQIDLQRDHFRTLEAELARADMSGERYVQCLDMIDAELASLQADSAVGGRETADDGTIEIAARDGTIETAGNGDGTEGDACVKNNASGGDGINTSVTAKFSDAPSAPEAKLRIYADITAMAANAEKPRHPVYCAHRVVDALFAMKAGQCADAGIALSYSLRIPADIDLPGAQCCAVFANMMDNAIHACMNLPQPQRRISIEASLLAGCLSVDVRNTYDPSAATNMHADRHAHQRIEPHRPHTEPHDGSEPHTPTHNPTDRDGSQRDIAPRHGWGLVILRQIAERHHGDFTSTGDPATGIWHASMFLPLA